MTNTAVLLGPISGPNDLLELRRWAGATPEAVALTTPGRASLSYSSLWGYINAASEELCLAGLRRGAVTALALPSDASFITAALAVTLRSACTALNPGLTADEYRAHLQRLRASTLITSRGGASTAAEVARELGMNVIRIDAEESSAGRFSIADTEAPRTPIAARRSDAAFVLLTSSTTGVPKMVPWSRENVRAAVLQDIRAYELSSLDRFLVLLPLHASHSLYTVLTQLACGGAVGCPASLDATGMLAAFEDFRPTWISSGPAIHRMLLSHVRENSEIFRRMPLRFVRSAGAPPGKDLLLTLENLLGVPVLDSYGLTEVPGVSRNMPTRRRQGSVGTSVGAEIGIIDELGNFLPPGAQGEVVARGPTLTPGYLDDPESNQAAFRNGWFCTGDLGYLDPEGFLFLTGRQKEMINRGGSKISPREVDDVLAGHPAVAAAAAFAIPHRTLGEEVGAAVVLKGSVKVTEPDLRRYAAEHLAPYKVPRRIVFVENIPRSALGKPKRTELGEQFRTLRPYLREPRRPPTELEARLIEIWRRILAIEDLGPEEDFFDLGGDSLCAARMLSEVEKVMNMPADWDGVAFFDRPTVAELAGIIAGHAVAAGQPARKGEGAPFFCFSSTGTNPYELRHLSRALGPEQALVVVCPPHAVQGEAVLDAREIARQSLSTIRKVQERGPYLIGGYCFGGVIAFETALQMVELGEEVALLVLIDTPAPGYPKILRQWRRYLRQGLFILPRLVSRKGVIHAREMLAHVRAIRRIAGRRLGAKLNRVLASHFVRGAKPETAWDALAMREYEPRSFPSKIVQFLASEVATSTVVLDDPRLGWQDFAESGFETRLVSGDHVTMLERTKAAGLAAELNPLLQEAVSNRNRKYL